MHIIPAIDVLNGDVVRLRHGDFEDCKHYEVSARQLAQEYAAAGAEWLHVVDLAASRDGQSRNPELLLQLLGQAPQSVQAGGGVRRADDIELRLEHGASRVVVGTICVTDMPLFLSWLEQFGAEHLVSALDVVLDEQGTPWPRSHGWTRGGGRNLWDVLDELAEAGLRHLLCTDISKDGALLGPNLALYRELARRYPQLEIQASGGVSGLRDLQQLQATGIGAAVTGKALLEGCFTLPEALAALAQ